jgi:hypothetical protein
MDLLAGNQDPVELIKALGKLSRSPQTEVESKVAELLDHEDTDVRAEAMRLLTVRWKLARYRPVLLQIMLSQEHSTLRQEAAYGLASITSDNTRNEDTRVLLPIITSNEESVEVRGAAYDALLIIHRNPQFPPKTRPFRPATDIDREWVEDLIRRT